MPPPNRLPTVGLAALAAAWILLTVRYLFVIALQTVLTGFFSFIGAKLRDEHGQRQQLVAELETALEENAGLHAQLLAQAREAGDGAEQAGAGYAQVDRRRRQQPRGRQ